MSFSSASVVALGRTATLACLAAACAPAAPGALTYPEARRGDVVDDLHGLKIPDPYRWLEETESTEAKAWIAAQTTLANSYLKPLPTREHWQKRLTQLWDYDKHGLPEKHGGRLFYVKKPGLANQGLHYWREDKADATETLLLDPNTLSKDGTVSVAGSSVSHDGQFLAYGLSASGSDWQTWHVINVTTGQKTTDLLEWVKFSGASWKPDGSGFYYARYDAPASGAALKEVNLNHKLYFHRLGTPQSADPLVYARADHPQWNFSAQVSEDGRFLLMEVSEGAGSNNAFFYQDLSKPAAPVVELHPDFKARWTCLGTQGDTFFFHTDSAAPKGRVVAIETQKPTPADWRTLIPESSGTLQSVTRMSDRYIAQYLVDAHDEVYVFDRAGTKLSTLPLPNLGAVSGFGGDSTDTETFYLIAGYTNPGEILRYDVTTGKSTSFWKPKVAFDAQAYETRQVFYPSKDGTKISLFLSHKKGLKLDGQNPTLLYAYGGFNISLGPIFSASYATWMEQGGVYAVANLRGGGEFGEEWHQGGMKLKKQNVFDDFISAAEFLIREKITSTPKLAISGGSNGGLLVGACLLQRPDLFGAAAPAVGVHDMIRFPKFTIGWAWQDEYGFPEKNADECRYLLSYSPYHNAKKGPHYPPTLISTADHDDRVFPAHSFKFGAALQAAQSGEAPILVRIESKAGHGAGTPTAKIIERVADEYAFFAQALGMPVK
jgi:prolyl oligopeptidase